ncbi:uncharacterized protein LOC142356037 [Convolutriloba macropyga]|uniref:uncharacterized protein LOC142356037 n=1 Tax=Convolutriloba macropyga TaxID=536237 RepID=UPI003F524381
MSNTDHNDLNNVEYGEGLPRNNSVDAASQSFEGKIESGHQGSYEADFCSADSERLQASADSWLFKNSRVVFNALYASYAIYESRPEDYLNEQFHLAQHTLIRATANKSDKCQFLIAEDTTSNDVFIAFKGTNFTSLADHVTNLKFDLVPAGWIDSDNETVHEGFYELAETFPLDTVLTTKDLKGKNLILCGHSQGGAISSIIYCEMVSARKGSRPLVLSGLKSIKNITFGSPLFGNDQLKKCLNDRDKFDEKGIYNIVHTKDPVPAFLCNFQVLLSELKETVPLYDQLSFAALVVLQIKELKDGISTLISGSSKRQESFKTDVEKILKMNRKLQKIAARGQLMYAPIGNFIILKENRQVDEHLVHEKLGKLQSIDGNRLLSDIKSFKEVDSHSLPEYISFLQKTLENRTAKKVTDATSLCPTITKIYHSRDGKSIDYKILGSNLGVDCIREFEIKLSADNKHEQLSSSQIRNHTTSLESLGCRVRCEFNNFSENELDEERTITIRTAFGQVSHSVPSGTVETQLLTSDLPIQSCIRKSFERCLAFARYTYTVSPLRSYILELSRLSLNYKQYAEFREILVLGDNTERAKEISKELAETVAKPMTLKTRRIPEGPDSHHICQKLVTGASTAVNSLSIGWSNSDVDDDSCVLQIGRRRGSLSEIYTTVVAYLANRFSEFKDFENNRDICLTANSVHLYEKEAALCDMVGDFPRKDLHQKFSRNNEWRFLSEEAIQDLTRMVEIIKIVHVIRQKLASETFIGIVGTQNAGKTVLLNQLCNQREPTGYYKNTKQLTFFKTKDTYVVDFPAIDACEEEGKYDLGSMAFDKYVAINDFLVVVLENPCQLDKDMLKNIAKVFTLTHEVVSQSRVLICFNQSGEKISKIRTIGGVENLAGKFQNDICNHLYQNHPSILLDNFTVNIFITEWLMHDEETGQLSYPRAQNAGLVEVQTIQQEIKRRLNLDIVFTDCKRLTVRPQKRRSHSLTRRGIPQDNSAVARNKEIVSFSL